MEVIVIEKLVPVQKNAYEAKNVQVVKFRQTETSGWHSGHFKLMFFFLKSVAPLKSLDYTNSYNEFDKILQNKV